MPVLLGLVLLLMQDSLTGIITYEGGVPANGVKVVAGNLVVRTDNRGKFIVPLQAARPTEIVVEHSGCETIVRKLGTSEIRLNLQLSKETKPSSQIRVGSVGVGSVLEIRTKPEYPPELRNQGIEGVVMLIGIVGKDGRLRNLRAQDTKQPHQGLVNAALRAVASWRYRPTYIECEPVEVVAPIQVSFSSKSTAM